MSLTDDAAASLQDTAERPGTKVSSMLVFSIVMFCVTFMSGGLIFGTGPFAGKLIAEGYIHADAVGMIFTGAFLILTWGAVITTYLSGFLGPQLTALLGLLVELPGFLVFALLPHPADPNIIMLAYGLIGWGGYMIFVSSVHFALLFPVNFGIADSMITGLFAASGLVFLILNADGIFFRDFFRAYLGVWGLIFLLILVFFPSKPYGLGDTAVIARLSPRCIGSPCDLSEYRRHFPLTLNLRFMLFNVTFSLGTTVVTYLIGLVSDPDYFSYGKENDWYSNWLVPIVTSGTVPASFVAGVFIKYSGFGLPALLLAICCTVASGLCLLVESAAAAILTLVLINILQAFAYTIQFVFLHVALPEEAFNTGLGVVLIVQGCFNLLPWPVFEQVFGDDHASALWLLLALSVLMYAWPLFELWKYGIKAKEEMPEPTVRASFTAASGTMSRSITGSMRAQSFQA